MKKSILPLFIVLLLCSCQKNMSTYQGDLFIPQDFSTACLENLNDHTFTDDSNRKFKLKANGDLVRKNPDGTTYYFKITSSISLQSDDKEGLCVLWLARDLKSEKELTIYLYETSLRMVYNTGEAAQYSMNCNSPGDFDSRQEPLTLR